MPSFITTPLGQYVKPPLGTAINWGHPLAEQLKFAITPHHRLPNDLVTGRFPTLAQGTTDFSYTSRGKALDTSGIVSLQYGRTGADTITFGTVFTIVRMRTNGATQRVISSGENGAGDGWELSMDDGSSVTNGYFLVGNNNTQDNSGFDVLGVNSENFTHSIMVSWSTAGENFYSDGKFDRSTASSFAANVNTSRVTKIGCNRSDGNGLNGQIVCVYAWARVLSRAEYFTLHKDPYCFLQTRGPSMADFINVPFVPGKPSGNLTLMGVG